MEKKIFDENEFLKADIEPGEKDFSVYENDYPDSKPFFTTYKKIRAAISSESHLTTEELVELITEGNNLEVEIQNSYNDHIGHCDICRSQFNLLKNEYSEVEGFIKNYKYPEEVTHGKVFHSTAFWKYFAAAILIFSIGYSVLFSYSLYNSSPFSQHSKKSVLSESSFTRGFISPEFQSALTKISDEEYIQAADLLIKDIKQQPTDRLNFYKHYLAGLCYLEASTSSFLILFKESDKNLLNRAVYHFNNCINMSEIKNYQNILNNCLFYLSETEYLLGNKKLSKELLKMVIKNNGQFKSEAEKILESFN